MNPVIFLLAIVALVALVALGIGLILLSVGYTEQKSREQLRRVLEANEAGETAVPPKPPSTVGGDGVTSGDWEGVMTELIQDFILLAGAIVGGVVGLVGLVRLVLELIRPD